MLIVYVFSMGATSGLHASLGSAKNARRAPAVNSCDWTALSWHEVWLVGFGGTLLAYSKLLASAFAGYYLALFLIYGV